MKANEFALLREAIRHADLPDLKVVVCSFFRQIGGPDQFAKILIDEFKKAKPGTKLRATIMHMMLQASKVLIDKEKSSDASLLTDEDLDKELRELVA